MGKVLVEPNIEIDDIIIEADEESEYPINRIMNEWGKAIPIIKIGDYVLRIGEMVSCDINLFMNRQVSFSITVNDNDYKIREMIKREIDTCIIFFGYRDWYIKFNGILKTINSDSGDTQISLNGEFYQDTLLEKQQYLWSKLTIVDVLTEICTNTSMGLFIIDNADLNYEFDNLINPNLNNKEFIEWVIKNYTNNIFCYDTFGFLHIGSVEKILVQEVDKMTISPKDGSQIEETDIIIHNRNINNLEDEEAKEFDNKIYAEYYTIDSNFSLSNLMTNSTYKVLFDDNSEIELPSNPDVGYGNFTTNSFVGFNKHKFPVYNQRINKQICGTVIKLQLEQVIYELTPFSIVHLELYMPSRGEDLTEPFLDEEHSGKKMIIGYSYNYDKSTGDDNKITQTLYLI